MIEFSVAFVIQGEHLKPDAVTRDLGLQPSLVKRRGERLGSRVQNKSAWEYEGVPEPRYWTSLEDGLQFLLSKLWPVREKLENYRSRFDLFFWVGQFQSSFSGGPIFSPRLLKALADFGVEVAIDCYFHEEQEHQSEALVR